LVFYDEPSFPRHADTAALYELLQHWDFGFVHQVLTFTRRPPGARTVFSKEVCTYLPEKLMMLRRYGPIYLDRTMFETCLRYAEKNYFVFLGKNIYRWRDERFWEYHRSMLKKLGYSCNTQMLFKSFLLATLDRLLSPVKAMVKALRSVRNETISPRALDP
jgi:hypothetical protein